ncbi:SGNH/GDSL hydrolase family protein [Mucilaginibacter sp.]|uniref:SGNH/GDSL hydrolase family protein n=1 Tax=Mucilaginibacter sp. TaxID=1882438 RepID=UPI003265470A
MKKICALVLTIVFSSCKYHAPTVNPEESPNAKAAKALLATTQTPLRIPGKAYFFGDSITQGYDGQIVNPRNWVGLVAAFIGWDGYNFGVGGTTLEKNINGVSAPQSMVNRVGEIPVKGAADKYLFFAYGLNDVGFNTTDLTTTQFTADYQYVLGKALALGWQAKDIVLVNIYYCNEQLLLKETGPGGSATGRLAAFNNALSAIAEKNGTHFININTFMKSNGADYLLSNDGVHPNETGYAVIAHGIEEEIRGFQ